MKAWQLINEILAGKMLKLDSDSPATPSNTYGLSNNFLPNNFLYWDGLENFLRNPLDWVVVEQQITFNDLKVGEKFKYKENSSICIKVQIDNGEISYGFQYLNMGSTVYKDFGNSVVIRVK